MTKYAALFLAMCLAAGTLSGCDDADTSNSSSAPDSSTVGSTAPTTPHKVTLAETLLYDENDIKLTAKSIGTGIFGTEIKLLLENNTTKNIALSGSDFIINEKLTLMGDLYLQAAAGTKSNGTLTLPEDALRQAGITAIATVTTADADFVDTDNYKRLHDITFTVKTSIAGSHTQKVDTKGAVLYDQGSITVTAKSMKDSLLGHTITLLIENYTKKDVLIQSHNVSANGFTVGSLMSDLVCQGTARFCEMAILASELEENGIDAIDEVSFTLKIIDPVFFTNLTTTGPLTVTASG